MVHFTCDLKVFEGHRSGLLQNREAPEPNTRDIFQPFTSRKVSLDNNLARDLLDHTPHLLTNILLKHQEQKQFYLKCEKKKKEEEEEEKK